MNTKRIAKLIENQYKSMTEKQKRLKLISLNEIIKVNKRDNIKYCFYSLCIDVLNECNFKNIDENNSIEDGFLVELSNWIFETLEKLLIFHVIRKLRNTTSYKFVDLWVVGNLMAAILSSILVYNLLI